MSDLPDSELLRVQQQLRLQASQEKTDPEYFQNISNRIGKILKEGQSEVATYSSPGMVRSLNYEGKHITQVMNRFEDSPIGFRVVLSTIKKYVVRESMWITYYHLLVKESEKHWIRVDENDQENQVVWDANFPISMVNFGETQFVPVAHEESIGQVNVASTWAISGKE